MIRFWPITASPIKAISAVGSGILFVLELSYNMWRLGFRATQRAVACAYCALPNPVGDLDRSGLLLRPDIGGGRSTRSRIGTIVPVSKSSATWRRDRLSI